MKPQKTGSLLAQLLSILLIAVGAALIVIGYLCPPQYQQLVQGLGIALFPAGVISVLAERYMISHIVDTTIGAVDQSAKQSAQATQETLHLATGRLETALGAKIDATIASLRSEIGLLQQGHILGVRAVYRNRTEALRDFARYLEEEESEIAVVGSSLLGLVKFVDASGRTIKEILESRREKGCRIRLLLTHPSYSHFREGQEGRKKGMIAQEIEETLHIFADQLLLPAESIRMYEGTPTCFLVVTSQWMLINPYPYETESYNCFCILAENIGNGSIYRQYYDFHYKKPWEENRPWNEKNAVPYSEVKATGLAFETLRGLVNTRHSPILRAMFSNRAALAPEEATELLFYGLACALADRGKLQRCDGAQQGGQYCSFRGSDDGDAFLVRNPHLDAEAEADLARVVGAILDG